MPAGELQRRSAAAPGQSLHHVVDVRDGRLAFSLKGSWAREVVAKGCSLDLHPRGFAPGACAQMLMAQCGMLIHRPSHGDHFEIIFDAMLFGYMQAWLADAVIEFSL
jgi:sarcosine oxidase subunit gamma